MRTTSFHHTILLLAGLLLSLHALVPHVHDEKSAGSGEVTAQNFPGPNADLFSLLRDLFTNTDLGEDHLEHFATDHDLTIDLEVIAPLPPAALPLIVFVDRTDHCIIRRQRVFRSRHLPPSGVYPDTAAPRGPPTLV